MISPDCKKVSHIRFYFENNNRNLPPIYSRGLDSVWGERDADREENKLKCSSEGGGVEPRTCGFLEKKKKKWHLCEGVFLLVISHSGLHTTSETVAQLIRILTCFQVLNHEDKRMDLPSFGVCCGHYIGYR